MSRKAMSLQFRKIIYVGLFHGFKLVYVGFFLFLFSGLCLLQLVYHMKLSPESEYDLFFKAPFPVYLYQGILNFVFETFYL